MNPVRSNPEVAAEVLFGSQVRGDHDQVSDRDILIVDDRPSVLRQRTEILSQQGWSVAAYTFRKLQALAQRGALFLQHLKMEGRVLRDTDGVYSRILAGYRPKKFYTHEIRENARLAGLLISQPRTEAGALWAADVLYVTVRNFGVLWLAEQGNYTFSYRSIVGELIRSGLVAKDGEAALLKLRFLKALYRSGERLRRESSAQAVGTALLALPHRYFPCMSEAIHPHHIVRDCRPLPDTATPYSRLRNLEKAYVALAALEDTESLPKDMEPLSRWISNPRVYAYMVIRNERDLIARMAAAVASKPAPRPFWNTIFPAWPERSCPGRRRA